MIGNYSAAIAWAEYQAKKKKPTREMENCCKNVIKCNRSGKLSYCKDKGGRR